MKETRVGSKGEATRLRILNGAAKCLATHGERGTTFQKIAEVCDVSQPLVVHYFKNKSNVFPEVVRHLLAFTLERTERELADLEDPRERLKTYFKVSLEFFRDQPEIGKIYLQLYYRAAYDAEFLEINSRLKDEAVERISKMIEDGIRKKQFKTDDVALAAKTIHNSLTGLILNLFTEKPEFSERDLLAKLWLQTERLLQS